MRSRWSTFLKMRRGRRYLVIPAALMLTAAILAGCGGCGGGGGSSTPPGTRASVTGVVMDQATNKPVDQARVVFGGNKTFTDTNGNFSFNNAIVVTRQAASATVSLTISKDGLATYLQDVPYTPGTPVDLKQILIAERPGTGSVSGKVTDTSGNPIADAEVQFSTGDQAQIGRTANDGTFLNSGILTGQQEISVEKTGFLRYSGFVDNVVQNVITPLPGIQLTSTSAQITVQGVVRDENAKAISGATVDIDGRQGTTDTTGAFSVSNVTVGVHNITVSANNFQTSVFQLNLDGNQGSLSLVLFSSNANPPGTPYTIGGTVTLTGQTDYSGITVEAIDQNNNVADSVVTAADGSFGLFVPAGTYTVRASKSGFTTQTKAVTVSPGGQIVTGVTIQLQPS